MVDTAGSDHLLNRCQTKKMKTSSETYADFTLSRIPDSIRESFTDEQYQAVRNVLTAREDCSRHSVDIRFTVPLFFRRYYFVLFAGRDRRVTTHQLEKNRRVSIPEIIWKSLCFIASAMVSISVLLLLVLGFYMVKRLLGIDLIPGFHLNDVLELARISSLYESS